MAGILLVVRTGCSWRVLPSRLGPWGGVYCRYQRWRKDGLWARILTVLAQPKDLRALADHLAELLCYAA